MKNRPDLDQLVRFNVAVLAQALQVIDAHAACATAPYGAHSGPHLRHVIEHYEAFVQGIGGQSVDYDTRARDRAMEQDAAIAHARVTGLQQQLLALDLSAPAAPIAVHLRGGLAGEDNYVSFSSMARELLFLASHATHHYALIQLHGKAAGLDLGEDFGKAPATVAHARQH